MSRQSYNVNTQVKLIDTHNTFNGGLKTVDTDDALRDFYLRQAENVSISEFGFLEKRYGLAEKKKLVTGSNAQNTVQGHYKFNYLHSDGTAQVDEILVLGGTVYVSQQGAAFAAMSFTEISDFSYPASDPFPSANTIQATREVGMARIKNNLYIFTGTYPLIYSRYNISTGVYGSGVVYKMPLFIPNWNEVVGTNTGVNLMLGADYNALYGFDDVSLIDSTSTYRTHNKVYSKLDNIKSQHAPLIPSANYPTEDISGNRIPQLRLEATLQLFAPEDSFKTFDEFDHTDGQLYVYVAETPQKPGEYYLPYPGTVTGGSTACSTLNERVVDDQNNYYVCTASTSSAGSTTTSYYQLVPRTIQYRVHSDDAVTAWEDVPNSQIQKRIVYSNANNGSDFSQLYYDGGDFQNEPGVYRSGYSNIQINSASSSATTISTPLQVDLVGFSVGTFDFKVVWHWERQYELSHQVGVVETFETFERQYSNITITAEQITFESLGYANNSIHTCNQVRERDGRLCVWGSTSMPEYVFFSHHEYHNWFPASYSLKFDTNEDEPIKSIVPFMNVLIVQSETKTFGIKGDTPQVDIENPNIGTTLYQKFDISPIYGTIAPKSVRPVRNRLYFLSREGIVELTNLALAFDEKYNVKELDRNIKNIVPRDTNAVAIQHDYQYWINFPSTGVTLRYYIDKKAWVKDTYGTDSAGSYDFDGVFKYYSKDGVLTFISHGTELDTAGTDAPDTSVYEIEIDKTLPSDFTKTIKSSFETANLNQGYPFHQKKYLESRLDFTLQNEYNSSKDEIPTTNEAEEAGYAQFRATLLRNHQYQLGFAADYSITNIQYIIDGGSPVDAPGFTYDSETYIANFNIPNITYDTTLDIKIIGTNISLTNFTVKDVTYDHTLNFNTFSMADDAVLNLDNIGYNASDAVVDINLGTVFGANETWVFDESAFNNVVTAVKTVKLSGRGYNYKLFVTDRTKAKWTIENLGITFKFKRARSR